MPDSHSERLAQALQDLDELARRAKRQEAAARRQARDLRRTIQELQELGIPVILERPHSQEAQ